VDLLARLAEDPSRAALFLDIDGVLAPIVPRPEDARVPEETQAELRRLATRYALVACISGRAGADAERVVGVPDVVYVGNHGLERSSEAPAWATRLRAFLQGVDWPVLEDKGLTAALHYRGIADEPSALVRLEQIAAAARSEGFRTRFGRKVLEILPPIAANKGTAVRALLAERGLDRALYVGDDTTDLDGFRALDGLELAVRVAVASAEGPQELRVEADIVLASTAEALAMLAQL
jgi:trehalose 6-phosphate phosphatase